MRDRLGALRRLAARCRAFFSGSRLDRELAEEIEVHLQLATEENVKRGMPPAEAARAARIALGGAAQLAEAHREARSLPLVESLGRELRFAVRSLRRDAGYSLFSILIAGVGIGAATTIASVVEALLLRPLPVAEPSRLAWIEAASEHRGDLSNETLRVSVFRELRDQTHAFSDLGAYFGFYQVADEKLVGRGEPERLTVVPVTRSFFSVLGVTPLQGRTFTAEEAEQNLDVVLLSERFWARRFARDPSLVGRTLDLGGRNRTVVGVVPFDFGSLLAPGTSVDFFSPLPLNDAVDRMGNTLSVVGRLRPGFGFDEARAEAETLIGAIGARHEREGLRLSIRPFEERVRGGLHAALGLLATAVGLLLLIVCANLSSLGLARSAARRREQAIRLALGGGRAQIARQSAAEGLLLAIAATALGLALAALGARAVAGLDSLAFALRESVRFDTVAIGFALTAGALVAFVLGAAPLAIVPFRAVRDALQGSGRTATGSRRQEALRSGLVVAEIAFASLLLVGAGLLAKSLRLVLEVDLGFRPERSVALRLDDRPPAGRAAGADGSSEAYVDEILRLARATPGIQAAGLTDVLPLSGNRSWNVGKQGVAYTEADPPPSAFVRVVSDGYLAALGLSLLGGRDFDPRDRDGTQPVVLVNAALAKNLWPAEEAIGKTLRADVDRLVVGVVGDVRHLSPEADSGFEFYLPIRQTRDYAALHLVARSAFQPAEAAASLRAALEPVAPQIPGNGVTLLDSVVDRSVAPRRAIVLLLSAFAAFALLLAALGIYGLISFVVTERRSEFGIRMALGATASDIRGRTFARTLRLAALGVGFGLVGSLGISRAAASLLYGVSGHDPVTYLVSAFAMAALAALASFVPASRAARTEPLSALRTG